MSEEVGVPNGGSLGAIEKKMALDPKNWHADHGLFLCRPTINDMEPLRIPKRLHQTNWNYIMQFVVFLLGIYTNIT